MYRLINGTRQTFSSSILTPSRVSGIHRVSGTPNVRVLGFASILGDAYQSGFTAADGLNPLGCIYQQGSLLGNTLASAEAFLILMLKADLLSGQQTASPKIVNDRLGCDL